MRRHQGAHVNADGTPKKRWPNPTSAWFVADIEAVRDGRIHIAYPCADPGCDGWHVGTSAAGPPLAGHRL